jgi:hypothetical protein
MQQRLSRVLAVCVTKRPAASGHFAAVHVRAGSRNEMAAETQTKQTVHGSTYCAKINILSILQAVSFPLRVPQSKSRPYAAHLQTRTDTTTNFKDSTVYGQACRPGYTSPPWSPNCVFHDFLIRDMRQTYQPAAQCLIFMSTGHNPFQCQQTGTLAQERHRLHVKAFI